MSKKLQNPVYLTQIILLGFWAWFQFTRGNELYAIFIIILFSILSIIRLRGFTLIVASVLVIVFFKTPLLETWIEIKNSNLKTFQSFKPSISKLFTPNSGKETLPGDVQQVLLLIQENKITEYQLCSTFEDDPLLHQRIVEVVWPAKKEAASKHLFCSTKDFEDMVGCYEIDKQKDVILANCP